jgi:hypothetical protein
MRPDISDELVRRVIEKWRTENKLIVDIPKSKIIEDVLIRYLGEIPTEITIKVRDRKRDKIFREYLKMRYALNFGKYKKPIKVSSAGFGSIIINNRKYNQDVIISYRGLIEEIKLRNKHMISQREFNFLLVEEPEIIVIGRGYEGCLQVFPGASRLAEMKGAKIINLLTPNAIKTFNQLYENGKKVVAYIHPTC